MSAYTPSFPASTRYVEYEYFEHTYPVGDTMTETPAPPAPDPAPPQPDPTTPPPSPTQPQQGR